jgi:hypothetical protein
VRREQNELTVSDHAVHAYLPARQHGLHEHVILVGIPARLVIRGLETASVLYQIDAAV